MIKSKSDKVLQQNKQNKQINIFLPKINKLFLSFYFLVEKSDVPGLCINSEINGKCRILVFFELLTQLAKYVHELISFYAILLVQGIFAMT